MTDVSIILTCLNEEHVLINSVAEIIRVMRQTRYRFELILVDDGSTDRTPQLMRGLVGEDPPIRALFHAQRLGRGQAVVDGFRAASGRFVGFIDTDLEIHARYIPAMLLALEDGYEAATAFRVYKVRPSIWIRVVCTQAYRHLARWMLGLPLRDTEAGIKFFHRDRVLPLLEETRSPGWFWDTEIIACCVYRGLRVAEIPCVLLRRSDKGTTVRLVHDSLDYALSLWRFRRRLLAATGTSSPIYRWPRLYHRALRWSFGADGAEERYRAIARVIPAGASVLDVCSGDCRLYDFLREKGVEYTGVDLNARLLQAGLRKGARVVLGDVRTLPLTPYASDYVVLQGSLYQFMPRHRALLERLTAAARVGVIVTEPVENLASSPHLWLVKAVSHLTNPGTGPMPSRFDRQTLEQCLREWGADEMVPLGRKELLAQRHIRPPADGAAWSPATPPQAVQVP